MDILIFYLTLVMWGLEKESYTNYSIKDPIGLCELQELAKFWGQFDIPP